MKGGNENLHDAVLWANFIIVKVNNTCDKIGFLSMCTQEERRKEREGERGGEERERGRGGEEKTNLFKTLLEMVGDGVVCCEEDGEVLRLLHGKGIHVTTVQNTLSSARVYSIHIHIIIAIGHPRSSHAIFGEFQNQL